MKVIVLGAGRIGRGFITKLMKLNGVEVSFFDASDEMVQKLNSIKGYTIHVLGHEELNITVDNVKAYSIGDKESLAREWEESDFIFTACGGKNMLSIGKVIGETFKHISDKKRLKNTNIVTCENWINPADDLTKGVKQTLSSQEFEVFEEMIGVSESVILCTGTGAPDPTKVTNEMDTWVQNLRYLPIDLARIKGERPSWKYVEFVNDFGNLLTQKIYTNNTSCGSVAYLGRLKGLTYMSEAANDPEIEPIMDEIYDEINQALIQGMGIDAESQYAFSKRAKEKYQDKDIVDLLVRIARDPLRKLKPNDRLIGPSKIALSIGVKPKAIVLATAAALFYEDSDDSSAVELKKLREEKGVEYILQNISELDPNEELYKMILDGIEELKAKGWLKEAA